MYIKQTFIKESGGGEIPISMYIDIAAMKNRKRSNQVF